MYVISYCLFNSMYLLMYVSVCICLYICIIMSVYPPINPSVIFFKIYLTICKLASVHVKSFYLFIYICMFACMVFESLSLSLSLSVSLFHPLPAQSHSYNSSQSPNRRVRIAPCFFLLVTEKCISPMSVDVREVLGKEGRSNIWNGRRKLEGEWCRKEWEGI